MLRGTIEIAKVNSSFRVKFGLILDEGPTATFVKKSHTDIVSRYKFNGNDYFKLSPNPFLVFDITSKEDRKNKDRNGHSVTINRRGLFLFIQKLRVYIRKYKEIKELFYYEDHELKVNREYMNSCILNFVGNNNRRVFMYPCVITDEENDSIQYEGSFFCINSYSNYACLTYTEMEYLLYELEKVDMTQLSIAMLMLNKQYEDLPTNEATGNVIIPQDEEVLSSVNISTMPETKVIPNI